MKINSVDDLRGVLWACNARLNDSPNGGRDAAKTALLALMLFAERALGEDLDRRLMTAPAKLLGALYDLDEGAIDENDRSGVDGFAHRMLRLTESKMRNCLGMRERSSASSGVPLTIV